MLAVGDFTWSDLDRDGQQDAGEPPISGVTVTIRHGDGTPVLDASGVAVAPAVTDANGHYVFDNLLPGPYQITFANIPVGSTFTGGLTGPVQTDSNANPATGTTPVFVLDDTNPNLRPVVPSDGTTRATRIDPTIDAGVVSAAPPPTTPPSTPITPPPTVPPTAPQGPPVSIGDYVWIDVDRDGLQGADEPPIPGVTLHLYDCTGTLVGTDVTDGDGLYLFDDGNVTGGLTPETDCYQIRIDNPADFRPGGPLNGYQLTQSTAGDDRSNDSNGVPFLGIILTNATTPSAPGSISPTTSASSRSPTSGRPRRRSPVSTRPARCAWRSG